VQLTGTIPSELGLLQVNFSKPEDDQLSKQARSLSRNASGLQRLWLDYNRFGGEIPSEIGVLRSLLSFASSANQLTGTLDSRLVSLPLLVDLNVEQNALTGALPTEIGLSRSLGTYLSVPVRYGRPSNSATTWGFPPLFTTCCSHLVPLALLY